MRNENTVVTLDGSASSDPVVPAQCLHGLSIINQKEGLVTVKNVFAMCMLSMVVAIEVITLSSGDTLAFHRADLIGSLPGTVVQPDSMRRKGLMRIDVIERIGSEGPVHSYTPSMSH
jgi:hypothetical protein